MMKDKVTILKRNKNNKYKAIKPLPKKGLIIGGALLVTFAALSVTGKIYSDNQDKKAYAPVAVLSETKAVDKKVLAKESIVDEIITLGELKVLGLESRKEVKLKDEKWYGDKEVKLELYYDTSFHIPFNMFDPDSITQSSKDESLYYLYIQIPKVTASYDESKTVEHKTKNTGVNWGKYETNIKEFEDIKASLKKEVEVEMLTKKMEAAKENTRELLTPVLNMFEEQGFKVELKWIDN